MYKSTVDLGLNWSKLGSTAWIGGQVAENWFRMTSAGTTGLFAKLLPILQQASPAGAYVEDKLPQGRTEAHSAS